MKCEEKGNHQRSVSEWMKAAWMSRLMDAWMTFWINASSKKKQQIIKCQRVNSICVCLPEVNVLAASEDLLSFWFFCLQAEWVHSENVTGCLIPLHHHSPFHSFFLFVCSSLSLLHISCKSHTFSAFSENILKEPASRCFYRTFFCCTCGTRLTLRHQNLLFRF